MEAINPVSDDIITFPDSNTNPEQIDNEAPVAIIPNQPPTAQAGDDLQVTEGELVILDGTTSSDPEGGELQYHWQQSAGTTVELDDTTTAQCSFDAPEISQPEQLRFLLVVIDAKSATSSDEVVIQVVPLVSEDQDGVDTEIVEGPDPVQPPDILNSNDNQSNGPPTNDNSAPMTGGGTTPPASGGGSIPAAGGGQQPPQPECTLAADCDDGVFCNGVEDCVDVRCVAGELPCPAEESCEEADEQCVAPDSSLSVTQYGITWTFDQPYQVGQFVNGDWWVIPNHTVEAVLVVSVSPAPAGAGTERRNGSMINPLPGGSNYQAFDGRGYGYNESLGVNYPVNLLPESSLVSTISLVTAAGDASKIQTAAVLTCLAAAPAAESFRPAYTGSIKSLYSAAGLRMDLLPELDPVPSTPSIATVLPHFRGVWLDHCSSWSGKTMFPVDHMSGYGREIVVDVSTAAGLLMLNSSVVGDKSELTIGVVQNGIDHFGILQNGGAWYADGGHMSGRKFPILFAGLMLNDASMLAIGSNYTPDHFGEDGQTWYVGVNDIGRVLNCMSSGTAQAGNPTSITLAANGHTSESYVKGNWIYLTAGPGTGEMRWVNNYNTTTKVATVIIPWTVAPTAATQYQLLGYQNEQNGLAEWGIRHWTIPQMDNPSWYASYRQCCTALAWNGELLAARALGLMPAWNHPAVFDYMDRYMEETAADGLYPGWRSWTVFLEEMWDTYRADY
ncbi:MAG: hypothetical protein HJJLKODD_00113 [Phycisphaerae bacterium]|nr:hypothetical protein [Phycisphaerae bacterium]